MPKKNNSNHNIIFFIIFSYSFNVQSFLVSLDFCFVDFFLSPYSRGVPFSLKVHLQWYYYNHLNQAMPLVILTEDEQVTYTPYMYSSISFVHDVVEHQQFGFSAMSKFYLYIDLKSLIYNIEVDLGIASLLDSVIRLNHL